MKNNELQAHAHQCASANDSKVLGAHLDLCERCRDAVNKFLTETSSLEKRLSKLTLQDLDQAGKELANEVAVTFVSICNFVTRVIKYIINTKTHCCFTKVI